MTARHPPPAIDRVTANDATTLATDRGPAPMNIGVILTVEGGAELGLEQVRRLVCERVALVPRLRQRLQPTPPGCGRPIWVDAADFDVDRHLEEVSLGSGPAGGEAVTTAEPATPALLAAASAFVCTPLPRDRPLWAARWVTGLENGDAAFVLSAHHALADGIGGLAVLAALCDPPPGSRNQPFVAMNSTAPQAFPRLPPPARALAADAWRSRLHALRRMPARLGDAADGIRELGATRHRPRFAGATSLNRPTGPTRRLTTVTTPLADIVDAAHAHGCTVNDMVLCAVVGAVGTVVRSRGEQLPDLVASVPVSDRRSASADRLGNHTGVMPLTLPLLVDPADRLRATAALTADRKGVAPGASSGPLGLAFRGLARVGAFQVFVDHQRLVHTFVTNVKGPRDPWLLAGHRITAVVPMAVTPGNVGVSFDILSYAGSLVVTLVADPVVVPDQDLLTGSLARELAQLACAAPR